MSEDRAQYQVTGKEETGMGLVTKQAQVSMFLNEQRFEFAQRIGKMLAASTMVPEHFRNNIGNCLIALNMSERLGIDVFGLMQTSYVVHGRPGFEAKLLIALFNSRTELFTAPLRWEMKGDFPKGQDAKCRAYAVDKETKEPLYGEWIDWPLVKAEGWFDKANSKWKTMPGQMFRYRSASWFINVYEPGLKMGIQTVDELEDMIIDVTPKRKDIPAITELPPEGEDIYNVKSDKDSIGDKMKGMGKEAFEDDIKPLVDMESAPKGLEMTQERFSAMLKGSRPGRSPKAAEEYVALVSGYPELFMKLPQEEKDAAKAKFPDGFKWPYEPPERVEVASSPPLNGNRSFADYLSHYDDILGEDGVDDVLKDAGITDRAKITPVQRPAALKALKQAVDNMASEDPPPSGDEE